jgi:RimJ/RimL family protein N-acetyltransferase
MWSSERLTATPIRDADVGARYIGWLFDPIVTRHMAAQFIEYDRQSLLAGIAKVRSAHGQFLRLSLASEIPGKFIGTITLTPEGPGVYRLWCLGILIGDRAVWGQGLGTEAIKGATEYTLTHLRAHKIVARVNRRNVASRRAFEKAGYVAEAIHARHVLDAEGWDDVVQFARWETSVPNA